MSAAKPARAAIYIRVSTEEQDLEQQRHVLEAEVRRRGWELVEVYAEKDSGANRRRTELARLMHDAAMSRFRILLVWSISRLGRDLVHTLTLARELYLERGVAIVSHSQAAIDMSTAHGRLVFDILAAVAEAQRAELVEATRRGMDAARRKGKHIGRPRKSPTPEHVAWVADLNGVSFAARSFKLSRATVRRRVAEFRKIQADAAGTGPS